MALRVTIRLSGFDSENKYVSEMVDVDLISYDEIEFIDYDIEAMLAAEALGLDDYNLYLNFYTNYKSPGGFFRLVAKDPKLIYKALEEQGYESFNRGDFTRENFAQILADIIRSKHSVYSKRDAIIILEDLVDSSSADAGPFSKEDFYELIMHALSEGVGATEKIIDILHDVYYEENEEGDVIVNDKYLDALISALTHASHWDIDKILDELTLYIDDDDVEYSFENVTPIYGDPDSDLTVNTDKYKHSIKINGQKVVAWDQIIENKIYDPFFFNSEVTDFAEHSSEWETPKVAEKILGYFEIEEEEPDDPDEPDHPVFDEDGEFAVLYTEHAYDWRNDKVLDDIEEQIVVPYEDESELDQAIELSEYILREQGSDYKKWVMTKLVRKKKPEVDPRQLEFDIAEYEPEPDPIWGEWELLYEDDE